MQISPKPSPQQDATLTGWPLLQLQLFLNFSDICPPPTSCMTSAGHLTASPPASLLMQTTTNMIQNQRAPEWV